MIIKGDVSAGEILDAPVHSASEGHEGERDIEVIDDPVVDACSEPPGANHPPDSAPAGTRYDSVRRAYPPILNTAQVAELLDLNPRTVLNMAGDGRLPASRLPGSRKLHFLLEDIITTLEANRLSEAT